MKKRMPFWIAMLLLIVGCATVIEPTRAPMGPDLSEPIQRLLSQTPGVPPLQAQPNAAGTSPTQRPCHSKLMGKLLDARGQPLPHATIDLKLGQQTFGTLSDENGNYGFVGLCGGNYQIIVTIGGQRARLRNSNATLDGISGLKFDLQLR